jgi:uncharacterized LabA/DUF88 family protein
MHTEVAMFIDFENLRYSLLNSFGQEPNIHKLAEKAKKYGRPSIMRAYADFQEHPADYSRLLQVSGIDAIHIPVKRSTYTKGGKPIERVKNAADMVLSLDAIVEAIEADRDGKQKVFLIVAGDRDYVKLVTLLRNRFGQRVVIAGVPGSVSGDLVKAAGEEDGIEVPEAKVAAKDDVKQAIVAMIMKGPSPLTYWSMRIIDQWAQDTRQAIPGTAKDKRDAITELSSECVLVTKEEDDLKRAKRVTKVYVNQDIARQKGYIK